MSASMSVEVQIAIVREFRLDDGAGPLFAMDRKIDPYAKQNLVFMISASRLIGAWVAQASLTPTVLITASSIQGKGLQGLSRGVSPALFRYLVSVFPPISSRA